MKRVRARIGWLAPTLVGALIDGTAGRTRQRRLLDPAIGEPVSGEQ